MCLKYNWKNLLLAFFNYILIFDNLSLFLVKILLANDFSLLLKGKICNRVLQTLNEEGVVWVIGLGFGQQVFVLLDGCGVALDGGL